MEYLGQFEPISSEFSLRENDMIVGLKNIGNTCYFNSILQVYFNLPEFVKTVFQFKDDGKPIIEAKSEGSVNELLQQSKKSKQYEIDEKKLLSRLEKSR